MIDPAGVHHRVGIRLPGHYNVANCLVALAILDAVGVSPEQAAPGLLETRVPGRLEEIDCGQDFLALVDYAHKPGALRAVLTTLARPGRRLAVVFGAGGERDPGKRAPMGAIAAELADLVVVTDDNPRGEDPAAIRREILAGAAASGGAAEVVEIGDRRAAIRHAVAWARPGDVVLIAGKGHETGQRGAGQIRPFDDRVELTEALRALRTRGARHDRPDRRADRRDRRRHAGRHLAAGRRASCASPAPSNSTRAPSVPAGCSWRCRVPTPTGMTMRGAAVAAGAVAVLAARPVGVPAIVVPPEPKGARRRRRPGRGARARRRRLGRGGAGRAGQAGQGGGRGTGGGRADHHRDHRLVGKDVDQRLGGRRARAAG